MPEWLKRRRDPTDTKLAAELGYWRKQRARGPLEEGIPYYEWAFTRLFDLDRGWYAGKRMLDVGCGPRGSLEWADLASERVGVDPLANAYGQLRSRPHGTRYVAAGAEAMPLPSRHFDVVSCFNALDHVTDVDAVIDEITRVTKPEGTLLLVVDIDYPPTQTEPHQLPWDIAERFDRSWDTCARRDYERPSDNMFENLQAGVEFDHADPSIRPGVMSLRLVRRGP